MIRTFTGIPLKKEILDNIENIIKEYFPGNIRIIPKTNHHITLKFIGNTEENKIDNIKESIVTACSKIKKFSFIINKISGFPSSRKASIIWFGSSIQDKDFIRLSSKIEKQLSKIHIPRENRKFTPHITVARAKNKIDITDLEGIGFPPMETIIDTVNLYKSTLTPKGSIYTVLHSIKLNSGDIHL